MVINNENGMKFNALFFLGILYFYSFQSSQVRGITAAAFFLSMITYLALWGRCYRDTSDSITKFILFQLLVIFIVSLINNYEFRYGNYGRLLYFAISILFIAVAQLDSIWINSFLKIAFVFSSVSVCFTYINLAFPNFYDSYTIKLFPLYNDTVADLNHTIGRAYNAGISVQATINSLYITIGAGILFISILKEMKLSKCISFLLYLVALFLTDKRGPIIFTVLSLLIVFYINIEGMGKLFSKVYLFLLAVISIVSIYFNYFRLSSVFTDQTTSGRITLYKKAIELFQLNPIFGNGWLSYLYLSGIKSHGQMMMAHCVYLQLLCEVGIIGLILFLISFVCILKVSISDVVKLRAIRNDLYYFGLFGLYGQLFFLSMSTLSNNLYDEVFRYFYVVSCAISLAVHRCVVCNTEFHHL